MERLERIAAITQLDARNSENRLLDKQEEST